MKLAGNCPASTLSAQQANLWARVNGYIEEMINGQKVVKVFCHEEAGNGAVRRAERGAVPQQPTNAEPLCQHAGPYQQQPGTHVQYVILRHRGFGALCVAVGRRACCPLGSLVTLHDACTAASSTCRSRQVYPAAQRHRHGAGGRGAHLRAAGRESRKTDDGYVELVNAKKRPKTARSPRRPERTGPLGMEASPHGGRHRHLYAS